MVHCLTLLDRTHALAGRADGWLQSRCGLSLPDDAEGVRLFAEDAETASCERCRSPAAAGSQPPAMLSPKAQAIGLFEPVLSDRNAVAAEALLGEGAASAPEGSTAAPSAARLLKAADRLHELFPGWRATVTELISETDTVYVRYRVEATDVAGLVGGEPGARLEREESAILRFARGHLVGIQPLTDTFALWAGLSRPSAPGSHAQESHAQVCSRS